MDPRACRAGPDMTRIAGLGGSSGPGAASVYQLQLWM